VFADVAALLNQFRFRKKYDGLGRFFAPARFFFGTAED
jgi:hypothetical protein